MTAKDLRKIYELLYHGDTLTAEQIAEQTGLSKEKVELGLEKLAQADLVRDGLSPPIEIEEFRITTQL